MNYDDIIILLPDDYANYKWVSLIWKVKIIIKGEDRESSIMLRWRGRSDLFELSRHKPIDINIDTFELWYNLSVNQQLLDNLRINH